MPHAIRFENHFGPRVIEIFFDEGLRLHTKADLDELKAAWRDNLKTWHSPYTCVFDCRAIELAPELQADFERMIRFFGQFFMKKCVGFRASDDQSPSNLTLPFEVLPSYEEALAKTGLGKEGALHRDLSSLRSRIQIDNDFSAHVMEIAFLAPTVLENADDVATLKDKVKNILRQWHTPYSVLVNVQNLKVAPDAHDAFKAFERFLKGFFCQRLIGYGVSPEAPPFPFQVFRSRHRAAAELQHQGLQSGNEANCSSRGKLGQPE